MECGMVIQSSGVPADRGGDLVPRAISAYYFMVAEKIIGLSMFSVFVVSYTRKVIK